MRLEGERMGAVRASGWAPRGRMAARRRGGNGMAARWRRGGRMGVAAAMAAVAGERVATAVLM